MFKCGFFNGHAFICDKQKLELELLQTKPGQLELPKLRKVVREEEKVEEKKKDEVKKKVVKKVKKKESDYELPEIADYERPALEKYEKSDFDPNRRVSFLMTYRQEHKWN